LPRPAPQFDQGLHDVSAFVSVLKWFDGHAVHVASAVLFAKSVKYSPAGQVVFFAEHAVTAFVPTLKWVELHAVHVASALALPAVKYSPAPHAVLLVSQGP
jgi:hypothetical protein